MKTSLASASEYSLGAAAERITSDNWNTEEKSSITQDKGDEVVLI